MAVDFMPEGYDPTINRVPHGAVNCRKLFIIGLGILLLCGLLTTGIAYGASKLLSPAPAPTVETIQPSPTPSNTVDAWGATGTALALFVPTETPSETPTPTSTNTLDPWSATGTAISLSTATATFTEMATFTASPTADYCSFLTPTVPPSPTPLQITPDQWSMTGTAIFIGISTLTPTPSMTPTSPRAWCDSYLPGQPVEQTEPVDSQGFPTLPLISPPPTWTDQPRVLVSQPDRQQPQQPQQPQIIYVTVPAPTSDDRPIIVITQIREIVTATPTSTAVSSSTATPTDTDTSTPTMTSSATTTPTPTDTPTSTPTDTETSTMTSTDTATPTPTDTPTSTPTDTETSTPTYTSTDTNTPTDMPTFTWTPTDTETPAQTETPTEAL